jgi:hypothetical protein
MTIHRVYSDFDIDAILPPRPTRAARVRQLVLEHGLEAAVEEQAAYENYRIAMGEPPEESQPLTHAALDRLERDLALKAEIERRLEAEEAVRREREAAEQESDQVFYEAYVALMGPA